jgi:hypothetical protein
VGTFLLGQVKGISKLAHIPASSSGGLTDTTVGVAWLK